MGPEPPPATPDPAGNGDERLKVPVVVSKSQACRADNGVLHVSTLTGDPTRGACAVKHPAVEGSLALGPGIKAPPLSAVNVHSCEDEDDEEEPDDELYINSAPLPFPWPNG